MNTLFWCLATVSQTHSFALVWKPKHISKLAAEDRCHLNGMAMENGTPKYVTSIGLSDAADGWRENRQNRGVILDVESSEVVVDGLSMPHSPRMHNGKLYVLNSGTGYFGTADVDKGKFEPIAFCPGYMRGLAFHNGFAIIGMSKCRENRTFSGRDLQIVEEGRRPGDPPSLVADTARAREVLDWSPNCTDIDAIVLTAWKWHAEMNSCSKK